jgi:nucleotide-binding universal stress UspA family protein
MKNILVAVELDNGDQLLLDQAEALASKFDAKVWVVHVADPDPDFVGYDPGPAYVRRTLATDLRDEHKLIHKYAEALKGKNIHVEGLLVQGPTVQTIFEEARKLEADLLILGSHKHNFLKRVFGDDVSRQVFGQSLVPLLIVPLAD